MGHGWCGSHAATQRRTALSLSLCPCSGAPSTRATLQTRHHRAREPIGRGPPAPGRLLSRPPPSLTLSLRRSPPRRARAFQDHHELCVRSGRNCRRPLPASRACWHLLRVALRLLPAFRASTCACRAVAAALTAAPTRQPAQPTSALPRGSSSSTTSRSRCDAARSVASVGAARRSSFFTLRWLSPPR